MHLFLDYDGVLHPDEVFRIDGRPSLKAQGKLFMWAGLLDELIVGLPTVKIILSTSWARQLGYSRAKKYLPLGIQSRVIGATFHSAMKIQDGINRPHAVNWWDGATRYEQIKRFTVRANIHDWIAIDDQPEGWAAGDFGKLVRTDSNLGLSDPGIMANLAALLR
jgi:hypothetical protein